LTCLWDEPGADLIPRMLELKPVDATHWSTRATAKKVGLSQSTVSRGMAGVRAVAAPV
jgi:hypothetical protein